MKYNIQYKLEHTNLWLLLFTDFTSNHSLIVNILDLLQSKHSKRVEYRMVEASIEPTS